ncbi:MAG: homocysteine S-methyltransferase family protein [Anaerovoracaceae bacterium]|jgi:5-methyltetrahydrofolate--homocysteine methyltransferase
MSLRELLGKGTILCDGAMGTMLQSLGMETGKLPEILNFTHPEMIESIHAGYLDAGSDIICTNTFGANSLKLPEGYTVDKVVKRAISLARKAVERAALNRGKADQKNQGPFVAQDIAPLGKLMEPAGDLSFEQACNLFKEQIRAGVEGGADLLLFETFTDIYELKAGIIAAKELCDLPIFCSLTFQEDGRMLMGTDPVTAIVALQDLGVDALGINCSLGPREMIPIVEKFLEYSPLPIIVQPNAGMPVEKNGKAVFEIGPDEFACTMEGFLQMGVEIIGGCCGTTPEHIRLLSEIIQSGPKKERKKPNPVTAVCSSTQTVFFDERIKVIGERINPTGKKLLKSALEKGDFHYLEEEAISQVKAGAVILDVNVGLPGIDEKATMVEAIKRISQVTRAPLQIDSSDPIVLEEAVRIYNGKPIINSVNGKLEVMDSIFPIASKYGANLIALALDEKGLPETDEERVSIIGRIIDEAAKYGIGRERIIADCLTLTVSAQQEAGIHTLKAMGRVKEKFNVKTTLGASNVSFGLPDRKRLNSTFLAMALASGLDAPITDPTEAEYMGTIRAFEALCGKDAESLEYIQAYGGESDKADTGDLKKEEGGSEVDLGRIILDGRVAMAGPAAHQLLKNHNPLSIVENIIIPSLEIVGKEYETGIKFLPQLIKSADTVKEAFSVIRESLKKSGEDICYGKIIMATVQGDIHDIGKNIAKVLLENYGYQVLDLGKDTPIQLIVDTAIKENVKLIGLSALMTTTVVNMEKTIRALREKCPHCRVAVGGAVLTEAYARQIGADYYCKDAMEGVRVANKVFKSE